MKFPSGRWTDGQRQTYILPRSMVNNYLTPLSLELNGQTPMVMICSFWGYRPYKVCSNDVLGIIIKIISISKFQKCLSIYLASINILTFPNIHFAHCLLQNLSALSKNFYSVRISENSHFVQATFGNVLTPALH